MQEPYHAGAIPCRSHTMQEPYHAGAIPCRSHTMQEPYLAGAIPCRSHTMQEPYLAGKFSNILTVFRDKLFLLLCKKKTLNNTEGAIKNGQSRETGNIWYTNTKKNKTKTQHNMRWTSLYASKHKERK